MTKDIILYSETIKIFLNKQTGQLEHTLYLEKCPVCGKNSSSPYLIHYNFNYEKCRNCGFVYANPRLNNEGTKLWYNSEFYNAVLNTEYHKIQSGEYYYSSSLSYQRMKCIAECLLKYAAKDASIFDVGCGIGSFLRLLKNEYGFTNLQGIELNKFAANIAREYCGGLNVVWGNILEFKTNKKFDVILCLETIEHINDLNAYGNILEHLTKQNGIVLLTTPYHDQKLTFFGGVFGDHYNAPNHVNFFNKKNLELFLKSYGFTPIFFHLWRNRFSPLSLLKAKLQYERDWVAFAPAQEGDNTAIYYRKSKAKLKSFAKFIEKEPETRHLKKIGKKIMSFFEQLLSFDTAEHMLVVATKN
ncbi:MAG: class I SAM-dependent methyltransferase [candidate division WOR-3 bacterium]